MGNKSSKENKKPKQNKVKNSSPYKPGGQHRQRGRGDVWTTPRSEHDGRETHSVEVHRTTTYPWSQSKQDVRVESLQHQLGIKADELEQLRRQVYKLQEANEELTRQHRQELDRQNNIQSRLQQHIQDLSNRLSEEMSQKISCNESSLENIGIKNRPMNVAEDYQTFCSNEWLQAKEYLDEKIHLEDKKLALLCKIIMAAETVASVIHTRVMRATTAQLRRLPIFNPIKFAAQATTDTDAICDHMGSCGKQDVYVTGALPLELTNVVRDFMRTHSGNINKKGMLKCVRRHLLADDPDCALVKKKKLSAYLTKCCQLAWDMQLQSPQMRFSCDGVGRAWMGDKYQDVHYKSAAPDHPYNTVFCYVHPQLYHGKSLMVKGKVYITSNQEEQASQ